VPRICLAILARGNEARCAGHIFIGRWDGEMDGEVSVVVMRNVDMGPGRVLVQNLKS